MCPEGFRALEGDILGEGIRGLYNATVQQCAKDCKKIKDCKSFQHSEIHHTCKLHSRGSPTGKKCGDYTFCSLVDDSKQCEGDLSRTSVLL